MVIRSVRLRGEDGDRTHFAPGERAWVDIEFEANRRSEKIAVVLDVLDEGLNMVFNTSDERLGQRPIDLDAGQQSR